MKKGQRIDKDLLNKYPNLTRAFIKQQIKLGNVLINNKKVKPGYILRQGDFVALAPDFKFPETGKIQPNPEIKLDIIYEDGGVIVIDKPPGLSVHPRQTKTGAPLAKEINNTLVSGLLAYYPPLASVGDPSTSSGQAIRSGIVHRLDKDTSGLMIIAKNQRSFEWLKKQFQERKVFKKYLALVGGQPKENEGVIKTYLTRSKSDPSKQKVMRGLFLLPSNLRFAEGFGKASKGRMGWDAEKKLNTSPPTCAKASAGKQSPPRLRGGGKLREATTEYKIIKKFKNFSLIEATPKTGRLHQIRVQFAWLGNPVAGDTKYGKKNQPMPAGLSRQFLHATELKIKLPNGQQKYFNSPLPMELDSALKNLK